MSCAIEIGTEKRLRAADAIYVATAKRCGAVLVSLDGELLERAGALTPRAWLDAVRQAARPDDRLTAP